MFSIHISSSCEIHIRGIEHICAEKNERSKEIEHNTSNNNNGGRENGRKEIVKKEAQDLFEVALVMG